MILSLDIEAHAILQQIIQAGECVVDATAGNGYDTLFLAQSVGKTGKVLAFDRQKDALTATQKRLETAMQFEQVELFHIRHECATEYVRKITQGTQSIAAIMFNLGYLPGSNKQYTTTKETSLRACTDLLPFLRVGGALTIHTYTGHANGQEESDTLIKWASGLSWDIWQVHITSQINKPKNIEHLIIIYRKV